MEVLQDVKVTTFRELVVDVHGARGDSDAHLILSSSMVAI